MEQASRALWIRPEELDRNWHPSFHTPEYQALDRRLRNRDDFAPLGTLVRVAKYGRPSEAALRARWLVRLRRGGMEVEETAEGKPVGQLVALPPEAIVLARYFGTTVPLTYWNDALFPDGGATQQDMIVLCPVGDESIAWLTEELASDLVRLQLRRGAIGSSIPRLDVGTLLDLKVRVPNREVRERLSEAVRERQRNKAALERAHSLLLSAKQDLKPFLLTAATFEGRLEQFENYLLEQRLVDLESGFFVEASTTDRRSDLYVVRSLRGPGTLLASPRLIQLQPQEDRRVNADWREWYWESSATEKFTLFNVLGGSAAIPAHLLARMTARLETASAADLQAVILPGFDFFQQAVGAHQAEDLGEHAPMELLSSMWLSLQRHRFRGEEAKAPALDEATLESFDQRLFRWLRVVFRPAVALKVYRHGEVAGTYLLFGPDQLDDPLQARALLTEYGDRLADVLNQSSDVSDDAARRESMRRLSWVMHQLNGPLGRATSAAADLEAFTNAHPDLACSLVPNEEMAKRAAAMVGEDVGHFTFARRLGELSKAIADMRRLTYQIRRLKSAQSKLAMGPCDVSTSLRLKAEECSAQMLGLRIEADNSPVFALANADVLKEAFCEVINNACRELKQHNIDDPTITIKVWPAGGFVHISIRDNGLPINHQLISNPFDEDASSYAKQGRGSGLGLTIVRETFRSHGGSCSLTENRDEAGARLAGVTFDASLPLLVVNDVSEGPDA